MTRGADEQDPDTTDETGRTRADRAAKARAATDKVRTRIAQVVWLVCVLAALVLAIGALCIALRANPDNSLVKFFIDTADKLDLGVFSRQAGVAHWQGHSHASATKNALVNWGLAAIVWLVVGKVLERIIRPPARTAATARH
jgi:hypothetical protein